MKEMKVVAFKYFKTKGNTKNGRAELICRDQSLVLKFKLAPVFLSEKSSLILSKNFTHQLRGPKI